MGADPFSVRALRRGGPGSHTSRRRTHSRKRTRVGPEVGIFEPRRGAAAPHSTPWGILGVVEAGAVVGPDRRRARHVMVHLFLGDHPASRRLVSLIQPGRHRPRPQCPAMPSTPCKRKLVRKRRESAGRLRMVASSPHVRGKVWYALTSRALRETIRSTLSPPSMELWLGTRQAIRDHTVTGRSSRYQPSANPPHPKNPLTHHHADQPVEATTGAAFGLALKTTPCLRPLPRRADAQASSRGTP